MTHTPGHGIKELTRKFDFTQPASIGGASLDTSPEALRAPSVGASITPAPLTARERNLISTREQGNVSRSRNTDRDRERLAEDEPEVQEAVAQPDEEFSTIQESVDGPVVPTVSPVPGQSNIQRTGDFEFPFFSAEGQAERLRNVGDVLKGAFDFNSDTNVRANVSDGLGKVGLEYLANHPFQSALAIASTVEAAKGVGLIAGKLKGIKAAKDAAVLVNGAEKAGRAAIASKEVLEIGTTFGKNGVLIKNTVQAAKQAASVAKGAAIASPQNFAKILGFLKSSTGALSLVAVSEFVALNFFGDNVDRLGISASQLADDGDLEGAKELWDLQAEAGEFISKWESYVPGYQLVPSVGNFIRDQLKSSELKRNNIERTAENQQVINSFAQSLANDTASEEAINDFVKEFPDEFLTSQILSNQVKEKEVAEATALREESFNQGNDAPIDTNKFQTERDLEKSNEREIDVARLQRSNELAERILSDRLTALQIIDDAEIEAFALDPLNTFSAVTKLYNEAITFTGRTNLGGLEGTIVNEAPSTLGFGLLRTGGQTRVEEAEEPTNNLDDLNTAAQRQFGVNFDELTPAQKAVLSTQ